MTVLAAVPVAGITTELPCHSLDDGAHFVIGDLCVEDAFVQQFSDLFRLF